jgi:hypothetical protein
VKNYIEVDVMKKLLLALALLPAMAQASEAECLSRIMYAEDRQSTVGTIAVGHATLNRSKHQSIPVCKIKGVASKLIPVSIRPYYLALAKSVMNNKSTVESANAWNRGKKPHMKASKIVAIKGQNIFYVMAGSL